MTRKFKGFDVGQKIENGTGAIFITQRTDILGDTYILCLLPGRGEFVSWFLSEDGKTFHGHYYFQNFHACYEDYLKR